MKAGDHLILIYKGVHMNLIKFFSVIFGCACLLPTSQTHAARVENATELKSGKYRITSSIDGISRLNVDNPEKNGGNLCIRKPADRLNQLFYVEKKERFYNIKCEASNKMLDVKGASKKSGANIQQYNPNETDAQNWFIIKWEDGSYSLISVCNNLVMDVDSGKNEDGTNIRCWELNGTNSQKFYFEKVE